MFKELIIAEKCRLLEEQASYMPCWRQIRHSWEAFVTTVFQWVTFMYMMKRQDLFMWNLQ